MGKGGGKKGKRHAKAQASGGGGGAPPAGGFISSGRTVKPEGIDDDRDVVLYPDFIDPARFQGLAVMTSNGKSRHSARKQVGVESTPRHDRGRGTSAAWIRDRTLSPAVSRLCSRTGLRRTRKAIRIASRGSRNRSASIRISSSSTWIPTLKTGRTGSTKSCYTSRSIPRAAARTAVRDDPRSHRGATAAPPWRHRDAAAETRLARERRRCQSRRGGDAKLQSTRGGGAKLQVMTNAPIPMQFRDDLPMTMGDRRPPAR